MRSNVIVTAVNSCCVVMYSKSDLGYSRLVNWGWGRNHWNQS